MDDKELIRQLTQEKTICARLRSELEEVHQELHNTNSELMQLTLELDDRVEKRTLELKKSEQRLREHRDHLQEMVKARTASLESVNATLARNMKALEVSEEQFRSLVATIPDIVYKIDSNGRFTFINEAVEKLGYSPDELMGQHFRKIIVPKYENGISLKEILKNPKKLNSRSKPVKVFDERRTGKRKTTGLEIKLLCRDSSSRLYYGNLQKLGTGSVVVEVNSTGLYRENDIKGKTVYVGTVGVIRDISERKCLENDLRKARDDLEIKVHERTEALVRKNKAYTEELIKSQLLEKELIQAQKMEAVGTLAGGIAHDFNNILSIILGFVELSSDHAGENKELAENLTEIKVAGNRARELIKQILTFARKSDEKVQPISVSLIAKEVLKLLRSTIPTSTLIVDDVKSDGQVMANPTQLHQIFMNLATNAAQAMEESDGGILKFSIRDIDIDDRMNFDMPHLAHGRYVFIKVSDTGKGIPQENLDLIFEPYFTTKVPGEGTGLGLSVVHGIVKNCGGDISVTSKPDTGTVFTIFLPAVAHRIEPVERDGQRLPMGGERILVVDDEAMIVKLTSRILEKLGYTVISSNSSLEALEMIRKTPEAFDLVITDMTMPHLTGDKLTHKILKIRPELPVIICTGYSSRVNKDTFAETGASALLMKPVNRKKLSGIVRAVLDGEVFETDGE